MEPIAPPPAAPRSLGEVLDAAFALLRGHGVLLVGLAALVHVPAAFAAAGLPEDGAPPSSALASWRVAALALSLVAAPIVTAGLTDACGALLHGRPADAGSALRVGLVLALPLLGTWLVLGLVLLAALVPLGLVVWLGGALPGAVRAAAGIASLLPPLALMLRMMLLTPVAVLERGFGPRALARASAHVEGQVLRVAGVLLVAGLLMALLGGAAAVALGALPALGAVASALVQALAFAYTTAVGVVLYDDVRARRNQRR